MGNLDARYHSKDEWLRETAKVMPLIWKFATENLEAQAAEVKKLNDQLLADRKLQLFKPGDKAYVYVHEARSQKTLYKAQPHWQGPFSVTRIIGMATYELADGKGGTFISWSGHMRAARDQQDDDGRALPAFTLSNDEKDVYEAD
jgi:hypothetical protein